MDLSNVVRTGDLIFVSGDTIVSKIIKKLTYGIVNHVGIVYNNEKVFETDLSWGKAQLRDLARYNEGNVIIVRYNKAMDFDLIKQLCEKYDATPYSWLDIASNAILSPLREELRAKWIAKIGTKKFAICSELSAKILYEATGNAALSLYEGLTPQSLLEITQKQCQKWTVVYDSISTPNQSS